MDDLSPETVTDAALAQMATTRDPRLREVMASLVRHLHDFARDVKLTPDEWLAAIGFLTRVGQACTPTRQEFILLSDVLGLSALVNLVHDAEAPELGTTSSMLGPFYREDAPEVPLGGSIVADPDGKEMLLYGRVTDTKGNGVPGALVQVWQTNAEGWYDLQVAGGAATDMRGNIRCDADGCYHLRTVRPIGYSIPLDGPVGELVRRQDRHGCRPAHIHFLIGAPGFRELVTALYLSDDPHIDSDTVFGVSRTLVVSPVENDPAAPVRGIPSIRYDFRLARESGPGSNRVGADPKQILAVS
ncbi:MAG: hydroxyquinol 1,2-dioxygenase [Rhodospirillales bacterium]|nr:hydroxyquinol 1,2-dioxygenase [Rhodospirillales bacterium]